MELTDKFNGFCAVTPNKKFFRLFERAGVKNILISYHYIRQNLQYMEQLLPEIKSYGGLFMVDSGAFSFITDANFDIANFDYEGYCEEYTTWIKDHSTFIFSAANLDIDDYIGHDEVKRLNQEYFEPLEKHVNIIYIAHKNIESYGELGIFQEYIGRYKYIGVSEEMTPNISTIFQLAKSKRVAIHGLAWTKPTKIRDFPFFSVDSSSWVNYQKYGATVVWDGTNFSQYDSKNKAIRKTLKHLCDKYKVDFDKFCTEQNEDGSHNDDEGLTFSIKTWLEVFDSLQPYANSKLDVKVSDLLGKDFEPAGKKSLSQIGVGNKGLATIQAVQIVKREESEIISVEEFDKVFGSSLHCDNCLVNSRCPKFVSQSTCAFDFNINNRVTTPLDTIEYLIQCQAKRVQKAMLMENLQGGAPNKIYTSEVNFLAQLNQMRADLIFKAKLAGGAKLTERTIELPSPEGQVSQPVKTPGQELIDALKDVMRK